MGATTSMPSSDRGMLRTACFAMGTTGEIIVPATAVGEAKAGIERIEQLERRWSRFIPDSEVSRLNATAGRSCQVSADTILLVELANEAWRLTEGRFDALLLHPVLAAGYDGDFAGLRPSRPAPTMSNVTAPNQRLAGRPVVDRAAGTVTVPRGAGFDAGGIGKGLAADLVGEQLVRDGVHTGIVNIGGDLRLWGDGPHGDGWHVGLADRTIAVTDAGVATSGTAHRNWSVGGKRMHHLIDPATTAPGVHAAEWVTVVAASAWLADAIALVAALTPTESVPAVLSGLGVEGVAVGPGGRTASTPRMCAADG